MSAVFEGYLEEFSDLSAGAGRLISQLRDQSGNERRATVTAAEAELKKLEELVQQMELEARSGDKKSSSTKELQSQAKARRSELNALRNSLKQAAASVARSEALLGESSGDEGNDRARLLKINERMEEGTRKLQAAHRTLADTEEIGNNIMSDLHSQRDTITHATGTLQRANEGLARSKRTLQEISRRALGNKLTMWCLIFMLAAMIILILWVQMFGFGGGGGGGAAPKHNATAAHKAHGGLR